MCRWSVGGGVGGCVGGVGRWDREKGSLGKGRQCYVLTISCILTMLCCTS